MTMDVLNVYLKRLDDRHFSVYLRLLNEKLLEISHTWLFQYSETNIRKLENMNRWHKNPQLSIIAILSLAKRTLFLFAFLFYQSARCVGITRIANLYASLECIMYIRGGQKTYMSRCLRVFSINCGQITGPLRAV